MNQKVLTQTYWEKLSLEYYDILIGKAIEIAVALLILFIGMFFIRKLSRVVHFFIIKRAEDGTTAQFVAQTVKVVLMVVLFLSVAAQMGIQTTSFVAALGAAGLAIGLALQGSLANFAGGILLLLFKPFKVGDHIEALGFYGEVVGLDMLHTKLVTVDNRYVVLPNGQVANSSIVNSTRRKSRRSEFVVLLEYGQDVAQARELILGIVLNEAWVYRIPAPTVEVEKLGEFNMQLMVRFWTDNGKHRQTLTKIIEKLTPHLSLHGRAVRIQQEEK